MMRSLFVLVLSIASLGVQQQPYAPKQSDRPEAVSGDEPGFQSIFDGQTLSGWEGDPHTGGPKRDRSWEKSRRQR